MIDKITEIETKLSFQDDELAKLNDAYCAQQLKLDSIEHEFRVIKQHLAMVLESIPKGVESEAADETPPHY